MIIGSFDAYEQAREKAKNPNMTTAGNPLLRDMDDYTQRKIIENNMDRLYRDAERRKGIHGNVYAGIMDNRYKGE